MLREFTRHGKTIRHTVIASSNLNRENMIPALLGLQGTDEQPTPAAEIPKRLINLLDIAAKPRALVRHLAHYNEQLADAIRTEPPARRGTRRA